VLKLPLISVCIPVYNSAVFTLVHSLFEQAKDLDNKIEIIIIDDCSSSDWKSENKQIDNLCHYFELPRNIGRSRIRNLFLKYAKGESLLFIDGDSEIISNTFLYDYLQVIESKNPQVVVGGSVYQTQRPSRSHFLRWKYSVCRESKSADEREKTNFGFKTNNFLIKKSLFSETLFNETLSGYGHEDTLFGFQLSSKKIKIQHIENPVLNKHLDSNEVFLNKTENAIGNLFQIYNMSEHFPEIKEIKLIRFFEKITRLSLISIVFVLFTFVKPILVNFLKSGYFRLWMFDFYKLGLFIRKIKS